MLRTGYSYVQMAWTYPSAATLIISKTLQKTSRSVFREEGTFVKYFFLSKQQQLFCLLLTFSNFCLLMNTFVILSHCRCRMAQVYWQLQGTISLTQSCFRSGLLALQGSRHLENANPLFCHYTKKLKSKFAPESWAHALLSNKLTNYDMSRWWDQVYL
jgi:hypothetical protein